MLIYGIALFYLVVWHGVKYEWWDWTSLRTVTSDNFDEGMSDIEMSDRADLNRLCLFQSGIPFQIELITSVIIRSNEGEILEHVKCSTEGGYG